MERITSLVYLASLLIMFASVMNQTRADICPIRIGPCDNCDRDCKARYGPFCKSKCDSIVGTLLCTCYYNCGPPIPPKICEGGAGMCSEVCPDNCCNGLCAKKYSGGSGSCNSLGNYRFCQCEYLCE